MIIYNIHMQYIYIYIYIYIYLAIIYLALNEHKYDTNQFPVIVISDVITMDCSFLLYSSGMYLHMHIYIGILFVAI